MPTTTDPCPVLPALQAEFAAALPAIRSAAHLAFRLLQRPHARADAVADVILLAWRRFRRTAADSAPTDPIVLSTRAVASVTRVRCRARRPA